jgi:hypothetical protein
MNYLDQKILSDSFVDKQIHFRIFSQKNLLREEWYFSSIDMHYFFTRLIKRSEVTPTCFVYKRKTFQLSSFNLRSKLFVNITGYR